MNIEEFKNIIINYYKDHKRILIWREHISSYNIVVSEIMLQQTQVSRVVDKFDNFIAAFPDFSALASAPFSEVLALWKGLGYNRRALNLQKIAQRLSLEYNNILPDTPEILESFPGIGPATARSIITFAFNKPSVFIETNIRTVFIYFFFKDKLNIHDREITPLVEASLDRESPREWYYALMDYGTMLKKHVGNLSRQSSHYAKQSKFEGSDRQVRGQILGLLLQEHSVLQEEVYKILNKDMQRVNKIIFDLCFEGYIKREGTMLALNNNN